MRGVWRGGSGQFRSGQSGLTQAVLSTGGETLTSNEDTVSQWKEHFKEFLNPRHMPLSRDSGQEASGASDTISLVDIAGRLGLAHRVSGPIFKKGDWRVCANYWGTTLLSFPRKIYAKVLERTL